MTIPPLPDTDVARLAVLNEEGQRRELAQMKRGWPPFSYRPVRRAFLDIFGIQPGPLVQSLPLTSWSKIDDSIQRASKKPEEADANLAVARALHAFSLEYCTSGLHHTFNRLIIGKWPALRLWEPALLAIADRRFIFFVDPRRTKMLTREARRFVFSVMHEHIRAANPDFAEADLLVLQLHTVDTDERIVRMHSAQSIDLFSADEISAMVDFTYTLWVEVYEERRAAERRRATGTTDGFL